MEDKIVYSILLDLYGELLTEKQKDIMTIYYNDDLSLAEISEHTNTSRQAIHDIIKRCNKTLKDYDTKLNLMNKYLQEEKFKKELVFILNQLKKTNSLEEKDSLVKNMEEYMNQYF